MKISLLFGKKVESPADKSGYILRVNAVGNSITSFTCVDDDEQEFCVPVDSIKSIKNTVTYSRACECGEGRSIALGKPVFDSEGNYVGKLTDIVTEKYKIVSLFAGNKKFPAEDAVCGDVVIIKSRVRFLKSDVKKNGKIIFRKGTPLTDEIVQKAQLAGEYVQTNLKTIN